MLCGGRHIIIWWPHKLSGGRYILIWWPHKLSGGRQIKYSHSILPRGMNGLQ